MTEIQRIQNISVASSVQPSTLSSEITIPSKQDAPPHQQAAARAVLGRGEAQPAMRAMTRAEAERYRTDWNHMFNKGDAAYRTPYPTTYPNVPVQQPRTRPMTTAEREAYDAGWQARFFEGDAAISTPLPTAYPDLRVW